MDQERKTRALRKKKAIPILEESCDSDSSDYYEPSKETENNSSDDSDRVTKSTRGLRKQKATTILEESCDYDSSDYYEPSKETESDSSDDSDRVTKSTRGLRKQEATTILEESCDYDSSDYYESSKEIENNSSDDSDRVTKNKIQKKRKAHNGNKLGAKRKKSCKPPESLEDDISNDSIAEVKKKDKKNTNIETTHNDTKQEATGKKSKGRGKLPLKKSTNQERKKKKGFIKKKKEKSRRFLPKPKIDPNKAFKPPRSSVTSKFEQSNPISIFCLNVFVLFSCEIC